MNTITTYAPNDILFILDPTNKISEIPRYKIGEPVSTTETCISIGTQSDVDDECTISLYFDADFKNDLIQIFSESITSPGIIAIVNSQFYHLLKTDVSKGIANLSIFCR